MRLAVGDGSLARTCGTGAWVRDGFIELGLGTNMRPSGSSELLLYDSQ